MHHNKSNILLAIFLGILGILSIVGFAHKFGYSIPEWLGWASLGATVLNYAIFFTMVAESDMWVRKSLYYYSIDGVEFTVRAYTAAEGAVLAARVHPNAKRIVPLY